LDQYRGAPQAPERIKLRLVVYTLMYIPLRRGKNMSQTAKIFTNGRSQAVRLPAAFRFDTAEVFIRKDEATGDVILSRRPEDWSGFLAATKGAQVPKDFLSVEERLSQGHTDTQERDPFESVPSAGH
jgi:antitoxin VapB